MNSVNLTGRIGREPEVHTFDNGNKVSKFSIAVDDGYYNKEKQEWIDQVEWVNIAIFKETKLIKGDLIEVSGKMKTRTYEKDGEKRYATEVQAHSTRLLNRKKSEGVANHYNPTAATTQSQEGEDDLPF